MGGGGCPEKHPNSAFYHYWASKKLVEPFFICWLFLVLFLLGLKTLIPWCCVLYQCEQNRTLNVFSYLLPTDELYEWGNNAFNKRKFGFFFLTEAKVKIEIKVGQFFLLCKLHVLIFQIWRLEAGLKERANLKSVIERFVNNELRDLSSCKPVYSLELFKFIELVLY